jgi:hypothetical protein
VLAQCAPFPSGTAWYITHGFEKHGVGVSLRMDHRCVGDKPVLVAHSDQDSKSHTSPNEFGKVSTKEESSHKLGVGRRHLNCDYSVYVSYN